MGNVSTYIYIERETCVFQKKFEAKSFQLKYNPPKFEHKVYSLKLIYIISSIYKPKFKFFEYILPIIKRRKMNGRK